MSFVTGVSRLRNAKLIPVAVHYDIVVFRMESGAADTTDTIERRTTALRNYDFSHVSVVVFGSCSLPPAFFVTRHPPPFTSGSHLSLA